jgi:hypothetical protein
LQDCYQVHLKASPNIHYDILVSLRQAQALNFRRLKESWRLPYPWLFADPTSYAVDLQVHLVPGSVEQRGTDLSAALAGRRPFCRALTWSGASLLLTAQLGEAFLEGAAAGRQLKLGLKAAGEGGVANTQAARVLPGGQMHLGVVRLPDVQVSCACFCCCSWSAVALLLLLCAGRVMCCGRALVHIVLVLLWCRTGA